jgi:hypothetical protein
MKSIFRQSLLPAAFLCLAVVPAHAAATINWGTPYDSVLLDSAGQVLNPNIYTFELGSFVSGFTPLASNILDWRANWRVFDVGSFSLLKNEYDEHDNLIPAATPAEAHFMYVTGTAELNQNGTSASVKSGVSTGFDFLGLDAYIWGYNQTTYTDGLEWVLVRSTEWKFPSAEQIDPDNCCPLTLPLNWSTSDLRYQSGLDNLTDIAVFGSQNGPLANGLGERSVTPALGSYELQTFTIPEPATAVVGLLLAAGILRRQRKG